MDVKKWKELLIKQLEAIPDDCDYVNIEADCKWSTLHHEQKITFGYNKK